MTDAPKEILTSAQRDDIRRALLAKGINRSCPQCGGNNYDVADGFIHHQMQDNVRDTDLSQRTKVPTVAIVCTNCGFMAQFAAGVLGFFPTE